METKKQTIPGWIYILILAVPFIYLAIVWPGLPAQVPMHFDGEGKPNGYGSPGEFLFGLVLVLLICAGTIWLINNVWRIDPKRSMKRGNPALVKISLALVFFMSALMTYIVYAASSGAATASPRFLFAGLGLLFSFLGNIMNNVKPNYFVGFRTPWALEDEHVWRKTHHVCGRLWFFSGLAMAVISLVVPEEAAVVVFIVGILVITIIPFVYSYRLYKKIRSGA